MGGSIAKIVALSTCSYTREVELVRPSVEYQDSYLAAMREFLREGKVERYKNFDLARVEKDFAGFVRQLCEMAEGKNLPDGYVPETHYWLVDKTEFVGRVSIRHSLTEKLLKEGGHIGYDIRPSLRGRGYGTRILHMALPHARELGISRALVTCDATNSASRKIIERAGGVLENGIEAADGKPNKLRFWIIPPNH